MKEDWGTVTDWKSLPKESWKPDAVWGPGLHPQPKQGH